jgi:hypothetical protein
MKKFVLTLVSSIALAGGTDTRQMVAVVDTGIEPNARILPYLCKVDHYDFTGFGIKDVHGHGTNVAGIIARKMNYKTHCLLIIKFWHSAAINSKKSTYEVISNYSKVLDRLYPEYVNMSLSGFESHPEEFRVLNRLSKFGSKIVVAAGNNRANLNKSCSIFPACYNIKKNFYVVGSESEYSNYGDVVKFIAHGFEQVGIFNKRAFTGTSQSAANFMSDLVEME